MERNSDDPIPEKFVLELKRQDEEGCWESNSSPLLLTCDVRLVEPCINEAIFDETTDDNLIPLHVITHVYLTMLAGGLWVGRPACLCTRISCSWLCRLVTMSIQRRDSVGAARAKPGDLLTHC